MVVGMFTEGNEVAYRDEVLRLSLGDVQRQVVEGTPLTKELILDFRRNRDNHAPLCINDERVERVETFKFLGVHISADLFWSANTAAVVKKAQQRLHF